VPQIFKSNPTYSLGVELELQLVDSQTGALANCIGQVLDRVPPQWKDSIKPEFMQSYCEINTGVCASVSEVEADLTEKLLWAQQVADEMGVSFVWAGTHPFSRWEHQKITPGERYAWLLNAMQDVARRMLVFGLHVHVGVDSGDKAIHLCDRLLRHIPVLLALSANSPFWCGPRFRPGVVSIQDHRSAPDRGIARADAELVGVRLAHRSLDQDQVHQLDPRNLVGLAAARRVRHDRNARDGHADESEAHAWHGGADAIARVCDLRADRPRRVPVRQPPHDRQTE
jgi:hypothetical protein